MTGIIIKNIMQKGKLKYLDLSNELKENSKKKSSDAS